MSIIINDLKEFNKLAKRTLNFDKVSFRYHNKNKSGGNFAINYKIGEWGKQDYKNYELEGEYKTDGSFIYLRVGVAYKGIGTKINLEMINSINDLLRAFVSAIKQEEIYSEGLKWNVQNVKIGLNLLMIYVIIVL